MNAILTAHWSCLRQSSRCASMGLRLGASSPEKRPCFGSVAFVGAGFFVIGSLNYPGQVGLGLGVSERQEPNPIRSSGDQSRCQRTNTAFALENPTPERGSQEGTTMGYPREVQPRPQRRVARSYRQGEHLPCYTAWWRAPNALSLKVSSR